MLAERYRPNSHHGNSRCSWHIGSDYSERVLKQVHGTEKDPFDSDREYLATVASHWEPAAVLVGSQTHWSLSPICRTYLEESLRPRYLSASRRWRYYRGAS